MFKNNKLTSFILVICSTLVFYALININIFDIQYKISFMTLFQNIFILGAGYFIVFFIMLSIHTIVKKISINF